MIKLKFLLVLFNLALSISCISQTCFSTEINNKIEIYFYLETENYLNAIEYYSDKFYKYKHDSIVRDDDLDEYPVMELMFLLVLNNYDSQHALNQIKHKIEKRLNDYSEKADKKRLNDNYTFPDSMPNEFIVLQRKNKLDCLAALARSLILSNEERLNNLNSTTIANAAADSSYIKTIDSLVSRIEFIDSEMNRLRVDSADFAIFHESVLLQLEGDSSSVQSSLIDTVRVLRLKVNTLQDLHKIKVFNEIKKAENGFDVLFNPKDYLLSPDNQAVIDSLIALQPNLSSCGLFLYGFSDEKGNLETNFLYSEARIAAVVSYLRNKGINSSRIKTFRFGRNEELGNIVQMRWICD